MASVNVIYNMQFGFRKNHSTSHAINYSINKILGEVEKKETRYWNIYRSQQSV